MFSELESGRTRSNVFLTRQDPCDHKLTAAAAISQDRQTNFTVEEGGAHKPPPLTEELRVVVSFCGRDNSLKYVVPGRPTMLQ